MQQKIFQDKKQPIPIVDFRHTYDWNVICDRYITLNLSKNRLALKNSIEITRIHSQKEIKKSNFAGVQPMLHKKLDFLILVAKECASTVNNYTNVYLDDISKYLNWIVLDINRQVSIPATWHVVIYTKRFVEGRRL